jgi:hypothetical protein
MILNMAINRSYNEKPIFDFINEFSKKEQPQQKSKDEGCDTPKLKNTLNFAGDFAARYKLFHEITSYFGMGLVVLPNIIMQLGGWC